jgi:fumarate reductase subunit D
MARGLLLAVIVAALVLLLGVIVPAGYVVDERNRDI